MRVLPAQHVRPYRRRNKTDWADAAALLEAARCGEILDVPVKSEDQSITVAVCSYYSIRDLYALQVLVP